MRSPFPGVDPFIEATGRWVGFHNVLIAHCSELLNAELPENYAALVEERLELVDLSNDPLPEYEEIAQSYVDIISLPGRELITSIEILSPTNKSKADGSDYLAKRAMMLRRGIHLVEIDLLLGGDHLPAREPLPAGDFYAFVSRRDRRRKSDVYAWSIRRALPQIPMPLKPPDNDVSLDLAAAFAMTYDRGRYDRSLRYDIPLPGSLSDGDHTWATERAAAK